MSDYDFKPLNDKEFEILCADLLGDVEGRRFERFKPGKDSGVDGRFFMAEGEEVVLQCKHWVETPMAQLVRELAQKEKLKIEALKPRRYLLAISKPLSRADKRIIHRALAPYLAEEDIYGKEDLNDLLRARPHIERRHYKLWLHSANVLGQIVNNAIYGRSAFSLEEIIHSSARYVVTANHEAALRILDSLGVVIVTGEPGVGKTTLADHLCLHYVAQGFEYLKVADDLREAEAAFDSDSPQIIYFDDFLGRNYLDALKGHEGSYVTHFIRRIAANKNKRFVLTSRSTILNQGKLLIDSFEQHNLQRNEYELEIKSLTELDKAKILYNHVWHSGLGREYVDELCFQRRYRAVIAHRNFNPRLISYITDASRLEGCPADGYWDYIVKSLADPSKIWENPFIAQQDDFGRAIIVLVVLSGQALHEHTLAEAYHRYVAFPENQTLNGRHEFQSNLKLLTGSFLRRTLSSDGSPTIDLFNPSIGDFVLARYRDDVVTLRLGILSLQTVPSLNTLRSLRSAGHLATANSLSICNAAIKELAERQFQGTNSPYVSSLCELYRDCFEGQHNDEKAVRDAMQFIIAEGVATGGVDALRAIHWGIGQGFVSHEAALEFSKSNMDILFRDSEIAAMSSLLAEIPDTTPGFVDSIKFWTKHVVELMSDDLAGYVEVNEVFSQVGYGEHRAAEAELTKQIELKLFELGADYSAEVIEKILDIYDVRYELERYYENAYEGGDYREEARPAISIDEIDDLFDRGE